MNKERWEQGSDFSWPVLSDKYSAEYPWSSNHSRLFGSGRDALRALITFGRTTRRWRRLWIPAYFCQEVVASLLTTCIPISVYSDHPFEGVKPLWDIDVQQGDVVLKINYFGLGIQPDYTQLRLRGAEVIEDHTHDIGSEWSWNSTADWCVASLRKVLPVPEGGVLWSPVQHFLPEEVQVTEQRTAASLRKLAGMVLKSEYLAGNHIKKEVYRGLLLEGEEHIADQGISGITKWTESLLESFPLSEWRKRKIENFKVIYKQLKNVAGLKVIGANATLERCPFSAIILFESQKRRDFIRNGLIEAKIYPAILWSLEQPVVAGITEDQILLSRRMMSIHCDMRYDEDDMMRVATEIRRLGDEDN